MPLYAKKINYLKEKCLNKKYICSGEIYKLLETKTLKKLICNNLVSEEKFLDIFDKYIGYVRDNYHISHYELVPILEETLKNKYSICIFKTLNIHDNVEKFTILFKKMFLKNIFDNTLKYNKYNNGNNKYLKRANAYLSKFSFDKYDDLKKIELFFLKVINNKKYNLYDCFKIVKTTNYKIIDFYMNQMNWLYEEYY